jgi:hypothetical protein
MWELQPLSNNRRTTEISLLLGENTSLTISQIPHNFVGLLSLHSLFFLSTCSQVSLMWCAFYDKDALFIYRQASLPLSCKRQSKASNTELVLILLTYLHQLVPASFTETLLKAIRIV